MRKTGLLIGLLLAMLFSDAQNIGIGTSTPQATLDVTSTTNGFLPPRMTYAQRSAIVNPAPGLMIFCTDCGPRGEWQGYDGLVWMKLNGGAASSSTFSTDTNSQSVTIGTQTWSRKNLDVARYRNGDPIPQVTDPTQWANLTTGAWCWYNNDSVTYASTYGRLYNWYAVNDARGLAPDGWHVASDGEWNSIIKYLDSGSDTTVIGWQNTGAGGALKSTSTWNNPNLGASNSTNFTALPGGNRGPNGSFNDLDNFGNWWTSTTLNTTSAWLRYLFHNSSDLNRKTDTKNHGFSVRLIKDSPTSPSVDSSWVAGTDSASCGSANVHNPAVAYGSMTDQDGNVYKTTRIGDQIWMAENLTTSHYRNGDMIPNVTNDVVWMSLSSGANCWYYNAPAYECPYGKLYNWYAVVDSRQVCPTGWHVPSDREMERMIKYLDPSADTSCFGCYQSTSAGGKMKSIGTTYWASGGTNVGADNSSGFSALPAGIRNDFAGFAGGFPGMGDGGAWWTVSDYDITYAKRLSLISSYGGANMDFAPKQVGLSVRCVKD